MSAAFAINAALMDLTNEAMHPKNQSLLVDPAIRAPADRLLIMEVII
jgi:hypothetical protein